MIEPVKSGKALLDEIAQFQPTNGLVAVWWLGQSGFLLESSVTTLLIDPYLSEHLTTKYANTPRPHIRMTRAPFRGVELSGVDLLIVSHKHSDHLDPGSVPDLLQASPRCRLALPAALVAFAEGLGIARERIIGCRAGKRFDIAGATIRPIPSAHEGLDTDEQGRHLYLGFVIEIGGLRFYHSGDSLAYDGLVEQIGREPIDVMFLPINGRDPARGVPGNMSASEAVALATVVRPRFVVPHHYDMFTFNTVPIEVFESESRGLPPGVVSRVLRCGERWEIQR